MEKQVKKPIKLPNSPSFIVEREMNATPKERKQMNSLLEDARIIQNTVLAMAKKRYKKMRQTKSYRDLYTELIKTNHGLEKEPKNDGLKKQRKEIISGLKETCNEFRLNQSEFEKDAKTVRSYYHKRLDSVAAQKAANRAWTSFEKYLYKKSKRIHFMKYGENFSIEGKSNEASVVAELEQNKLKVRYGKQYFKLKPIKKKIYIWKKRCLSSNYLFKNL